MLTFLTESVLLVMILCLAVLGCAVAFLYGVYRLLISPFTHKD